MFNPESITPLDDDLPMFSRGGNVFGYLDDHYDFRINGDMKLDIFRKARADGFTDAAEYVRKVLALDMYGEEHVRRIALERVFGVGNNVRQKQDGAA